MICGWLLVKTKFGISVLKKTLRIENNPKKKITPSHIAEWIATGSIKLPLNPIDFNFKEEEKIYNILVNIIKTDKFAIVAKTPWIVGNFPIISRLKILPWVRYTANDPTKIEPRKTNKVRGS